MLGLFSDIKPNPFLVNIAEFSGPIVSRRLRLSIPAAILEKPLDKNNLEATQ